MTEPHFKLLEEYYIKGNLHEDVINTFASRPENHGIYSIQENPNLSNNFLQQHTPTPLIEVMAGNRSYQITEYGKEYYLREKIVQSENKRKRSLEDALLSSSVNSNTWSPRWAFLAALFALGSIITSIVAINKKNESLSTPLILIEQQLQNQNKQMQQIVLYLQTINQSILSLKDSLNK